VLLNACKDIGLVLNRWKTKNMEIGRHRGMIANAHVKKGSNSYEKVKIFKYLGSLLTNRNSIQENIKCRLKEGSSCYYSVLTLLYSGLLSKNLKIKIYKAVTLPAVLYGCETWPLTLREEFWLRLFETKILRRIFGPKRDENKEWRRLDNEEINSLYRSPNIVSVIQSRRLRWAGDITRMEEDRSAFKILTGKPTGKRTLGRPRRRWEGNIS
jgi:hypothetical protein